MLTTFKAIEFMSYGEDVSQYSYEKLKGYWNVKDKKWISKLSSNVQKYIIEMNAELKEFLDMFSDYVVRDGNTYKNLDEEELNGDINIKVTFEMFLETVRVLYKAGISTFSSIDKELLDPVFLARMKKIDATFDRTAPIDNSFIKTLTIDNTRKWFDAMTAITYNEVPAVKSMIVNAYNTRHKSFNINGFEKYPVYDNRIFIPLNEADLYRIKKAVGDRWKDVYDGLKYIVISKNLYDYYFCSWGSEFQSCYSINSSCMGFYGMLPFGILEDHYIVYATKDHPQKTSMDGTGNKWQTPYMYWRAWGWVSDKGNLLLDKFYTNGMALADACLTFMKGLGVSVESSEIRSAKDFKEFFGDYSLRFYPDSIRLPSFSFSRGNGSRSFSGKNAFNYNDRDNLKEVLDTIQSYSDSFNPLKDFIISEGRLMNPKRCPVTNLLIDESESQSKYAKHLNSPIKHFLAMTYIDGFPKVDATTDTKFGSDYDYSERYTTVIGQKEFGTFFPCVSGYMVTLKALKDFLKGFVKDSVFDVILLRAIEDDKVTYIKYKKPGVF